jgi:uncharacterized delta-60 repeat protein
MRIIIIILLAGYISSFSQVNQIWTRRYNGPGNSYDEATSVAIDNTGYIYIAGGSTGAGSELDYAVRKYNADGGLIWTARYNGPGNSFDDAYLVKCDIQGNVYIGGASTGAGSGLDYCVVKYNSSGVLQWVYRYNGPGNLTDEVYSLQIDVNGNVYITGYSNGGSTMDDICTIKLNSSGSAIWIKRVNGSANNDDYGNSVVIDQHGNSYVTGAVTRSGSDLDYITIKYDTDGNMIWSAYYNGPGNGIDFPSSNAIDASGNIYVTGFSQGTASTAMDYCTIKYNNNGVLQWVSRYNGIPGGVDEAFNVVIDNYGYVYVTGNSEGNGSGDDYLSVKYNNNGVQLWAARYNSEGNSDDYCNWITVDQGGNVYVTGITGTGSFQDIATIGYDPYGNQIWVRIYNGTGNEFDSGNSLTVDNSGNVYVAGGSDNPNNTDFILIKYNSTIGINPEINQKPSAFMLHQNYPNPFNAGTIIRLDIAEESPVKLIIYDVLGRELPYNYEHNLLPGTYEVTFDGSSYSSGIYYYRLITDRYTQTRSMILVK